MSALPSGNRKELTMRFGKGQDGTRRAAGRKAGETKLERLARAWGGGGGPGSADDKTEGEEEPPREV